MTALPSTAVESCVAKVKSKFHHLIGLGMGDRETFDFGPLHSGRQQGLATDKERVEVGPTIRSIGNSCKVVQVELPLKAGKGSHFEILRHDRTGKFFGTMNGKSLAVLEETGNIRRVMLLTPNQTKPNQTWR